MAQSSRSRRRFFFASAMLAGAVALARRARLSPARVAGDSMEPTLRDGDLVAVTPSLGGPSYGTIVLVRRADGVENVKRVVGTPGDAFRSGTSEIRLAAGRYAVAGDNRARSTDSRHYGPVSSDEIVAVVRVCYWPPRSWRLFPR